MLEENFTANKRVKIGGKMYFESNLIGYNIRWEIQEASNKELKRVFQHLALPLLSGSISNDNK